MNPAAPALASSAPALALATPAGASCTARLGRSRYGTLLPHIEVRLPRGSHFRLMKAALHQLAAAVESATPRSERWLVQVEPVSDALGHVSLELVDGTEAEAQRGLALLRAVLSATTSAAPAAPAS